MTSRLWADPAIEEIRADDLRDEYDYCVDIMSRVGTEITYDDLEFDTVDVNGVMVRLATPATLYRMKRGTLRPIDRIDAERLKQKFDLSGRRF